MVTPTGSLFVPSRSPLSKIRAYLHETRSTGPVCDSRAQISSTLPDLDSSSMHFMYSHSIVRGSVSSTR